MAGIFKILKIYDVKIGIRKDFAISEEIEIQKAFEQLVLDAEGFAPLERDLGEFNVFEALGYTQAEYRHSNFLAFLMDPNGTHGMGDFVLRRLVQYALSSTSEENRPVNLISFSLADLDGTLVLREYQNIDILAVSDEGKLAIVIENKIRSSEHSQQLQRYRENIEREYPNHTQIYLYLTPELDEPSDVKFIPISYLNVTEIVEECIALPASKVSQIVRSVLEQYLHVLRRYIVADEKLNELAKAYYQKHKVALDFVFEQRPDLQSDTSAYLASLIENEEMFRSDRVVKSFINFFPVEWENIGLFKSISPLLWTRTGRGILLEFRNTPSAITLALVLGPLQDQSDRERIYSYCRKNSDVFTKGSKTLSPQFVTLWSRRVVAKKDIEDANSIDDLMPKLDKAWEKFKSDDFPSISKNIQSEFSLKR